MKAYSKLILAIGMMWCLPAADVSAETVTRAEASRYARIFFNKAFGTDDARPEFVYNGKNFTTDRLFSPFYVFNRKDGGYVIISAENKGFPVLGFGKEGKFDFGKLKPEEKERLAEFAHDIEVVRYDPRYPEKAVEAWVKYPEYVEKLLGYGHDKLLVPSATEFEYPREQEASDSTAVDIPFPAPFAFYEEFVADTRAAEQKLLEMFDDILNPKEPQLTQSGGDSFQIQFPEEVVEGKIFNLQGMVMDIITVKDSDTVVVKLDREMPGFYLALFKGKSGKPYGMKLYKSK